MSIRKQPLSPERMQGLGKSYRQMYILASLLDYEYSNYMDTNFKNPVTHQKISVIKSNVDHVIKAHKLAVNVADTDGIIDTLSDLNEVIKLLTNMSPSQLREFLAGFEAMVEKEDKQ